MQPLDKTVIDFVHASGAVAAGISTPETLAGGPPSTDLKHILPEAKAAVTFAMALDQDAIELFLQKKDPVPYNENNIQVNLLVNGAALQLASFLNMLGNISVPVVSNNVYRKDTPLGYYDEKPDISHRYLAVRSGVGHFGKSGNVIRKPEGANIILGSVITAAELTATEPLSDEHNYCDDCMLCMSACASGFMHPKESTSVVMGGREFRYSKRRTHWRCDYVCGGFSGLHKSGKWSTWSPARFPIPEKDDDFQEAILAAIKPLTMRPLYGPISFNAVKPGYKGNFTCGHCQLICHPDKEVRKRRLKAITSSGVVVQDPDGILRAVSPDEAKAHLDIMDVHTRALYE